MLIDAMMLKSAERLPGKNAIIHNNSRLTYEDFAEGSMRLGVLLQEKGLRHGDRVLIALDNSINYPIAYIGVLYAGCVTVTINPVTTPAGLVKIINDCEPKAIITTASFIKRVKKGCVLPYKGQLIILRSSHKNISASGLPSNKRAIVFNLKASHDKTILPYPCGRSRSDLASIFYTSGTTSSPKGCMLSHENLCSNTASIVKYLSLTAEDRVMVVLPFFYSYGNSLLLTHVMQGGSLVLSTSFLYPNVVLDTMAREEITGFSGVPTTFAILLHRSNIRRSKLPSLRYVTQAGGAMPYATTLEISKILPHIKIYIMYGQTEASARLSYLSWEVLHQRQGSIGKGIPGVTLRVLNEDDREVIPGETGEIVAEGKNIMSGYWNNPEETALVLRNGMLYTGDMATVDKDGYIYIISRKKDMIKVGGHRVAPMEIEEVLLLHEKVFEAAVIGKEDAILGEAIYAFVVLKEGQHSTGDGLLAFCKTNLPPHKVPKSIVFVDSLPKTASGKVKKAELRTYVTSE